MRILTAGESHGEYEVAVVEGFPRGVKIVNDLIDRELKRRMSGYGRGARMVIESDSVKIVSGLRNKITLGSPIALLVKNYDHKIFTQHKDGLNPITTLRPAHADLAGSLKYGERDARNILERASARETVARVAAGSLCKQFLSNFNIRVASYVSAIGAVVSNKRPQNIAGLVNAAALSPVGAIDKAKEKAMIQAIDKAKVAGDSLGGVVEVWAGGVCPGLGSVMHYDKRLDAALAAGLMSIPSVKGVEIGLGFTYAALPGSKAHDAITYKSRRGFAHKTNHSGGIEGGISNGETITARIALKPIATLARPLASVDIVSKKSRNAAVVRSDTCAVTAAGVIAESMTAIALARAFLEKFGGDSLKEIAANYKNYLKTLK